MEKWILDKFGCTLTLVIDGETEVIDANVYVEEFSEDHVGIIIHKNEETNQDSQEDMKDPA